MNRIIDSDVKKIKPCWHVVIFENSKTFLVLISPTFTSKNVFGKVSKLRPMLAEYDSNYNVVFMVIYNNSSR